MALADLLWLQVALRCAVNKRACDPLCLQLGLAALGVELGLAKVGDLERALHVVGIRFNEEEDVLRPEIAVAAPLAIGVAFKSLVA